MLRYGGVRLVVSVLAVALLFVLPSSADTNTSQPVTTTPPPTPAPLPVITIVAGPTVSFGSNQTRLQVDLATTAGTSLYTRVALNVTVTTDDGGAFNGTVCQFFFRETQFSAGGPLSSLWLSFHLQNAVRDRSPLFLTTLGYLDTAAGVTWDFGILPGTQPATPVPPTTRNPNLPPLPFIPAPFGGKVIDQNITVGGSGSGSSSGTTVGVVVGVIVGCIVLAAGVGFIKWYTNKQQNSKGGSKYVPGQV